jgi:c-di-GMP phosphodiesterase
MPKKNSAPSKPVSISVARQGIFDKTRRLWGFELFCVGPSGKTSFDNPLVEDVATSIASSAGIGLKKITARKKRVVINISEKGLVDKQVYALPPEQTTVLVTENVYRNESVQQGVDQLKADGFQIAVPDFSGSEDCEQLYVNSDIIGISVQNSTPEKLTAVLEAAKKYRAIPMARLVEDADLFSVCQEKGFELFQGAFSKAPDIVSLTKLSSNHVTRFKLLEVIEADDPDLQLLAEKIQSDAAISFRLLSYLNSASFAFSQKIKSISHAVNMLGWNKIKTWLRVVLLSDMSEGDESSELLRTSSQRAKFLELISEKYPFWGFDPNSLHMLGLFSLLDVMVGASMTELVTFLPLDGKLKAALCRESNNEYLPFLTLIQYFEEARWDDAKVLVQQLNLDDAEVREAFQIAVEWAEDLDIIFDAS